jgi:hypothetical protein
VRPGRRADWLIARFHVRDLVPEPTVAEAFEACRVEVRGERAGVVDAALGHEHA